MTTSDRRGEYIRLSTHPPAHNPAKDVDPLRDVTAQGAGYHPEVTLVRRFHVNPAAVQTD